MALNNEKFEIIGYGNNKDIKKAVSYMINDQCIKEKENIKDCGIHISSDGTFTHYINKVTESARCLSEWKLTTFTTREEHFLKTLWKALVVPRLEYCCQLCSPHTI